VSQTNHPLTSLSVRLFKPLASVLAAFFHSRKQSAQVRGTRTILLLACQGILLTLGIWGLTLYHAAAAQNTREIRVVSTNATPGQNLTVALELVSQGDENAVGFSLNFNPAHLTFQNASLGTGVLAGTSFFVNPNAVASGRLGLTLALPPDQNFPAGVRQVLTVSFSAAATATGNTALSFGDDPARRDVSDVNGNSLASLYTAGTVTFVQNNPVPVIASLVPASREAGSGAFPLTVNGTSFINGSVVRWQGGDRATTFVSSTQLTADISAADVASAGTASVTVFNPLPGGGGSNAASFTINAGQTNPVPVIANLEPASRATGTGAFTLAINGSSFLNSSSVRWNGSDRLTAFINPTRLTIEVTAADLAAPGSAVLTVFNPAPGGGVSNGVTFTITQPPNPVPTITSLNPSSVNAGNGAFTLSLSGANFVNGALVRWNGSDRTTTFVSSTQLTAAIPASDTVSNGTATITVFNPLSTGGGGGLSNAVTFTINVTPNPVPALSSLNPATALAGGASFTLTVNGSGFVNGATVRWNGANRTTTFGSATQLTAAIPASDIASAGTASLTVFNPANASGGGGLSNELLFTINPLPNPVPALTSLTPNAVSAGGAGFTLTVNGSNFVSGAAVRWNGSDRATTFVNATQLTALILAADIASTGTASVTVSNPANISGGGGVSNALAFGINPPPNPTPALTSLTPNAVNAGSGGFTLTVNGSNFISTSVVRWNGSDRVTSFVSEMQLTAVIAAADVASAGTANVTVFTPAPGGGSSNALGFSIGSPPNPVPTLASLSPANASAGGAGFTLTVNGSNFVNGATVLWNGANRTTTFVSAAQLTALIAAADIASAGSASLSVINPAPGGGTSNALTFTINPLPVAVPVLSSIFPAQALAGSSALTLTVNGANFVSNSVVRWNNVNRVTTLVSATQLTAAIPAADLATGGTASVTVFNEPNTSGGGGSSNALSFSINNPVPTLASLTPATVNAGSGAFTLSVSGTNFVTASVVRWNGENRATTFVSATQLTAQISASDVETANISRVTVFTPEPGGGVSSGVSFTVATTFPAPALTSLTPNAANAGSGAFMLTVNGTGFVTNSAVRWNNAERATTFVSATQLTAQISAADLANAGTASVTVVTPAPGGGTSNALSFTINVAPNPVPAISSLNPNQTNQGGAAFTLTVNGTNLVSGATVRWNGANRQTFFINTSQLTAQIPASDIANPGTASLTVVNPASSNGGGGTSNELTFTINPVTVTLPPVLNSLNPSFAFAGGPSFTLTVNGANFLGGSSVRWNGSDRPTTFVSATQLRASIPAADIATAGAAQITVFNPGVTGGGNGLSNALNFAIAAPLANVSAASFTGNELAADLIVASFGAHLATGIELANSLPLPTTLLGTTVRVIDSTNFAQPAQLFFVAPTQINYLMPAGLAPGAATILVTSADGTVSASTVTIANVAPGLFTANANGQGVPAGFLVRVRANGTQSFEPIAAPGPTGQQAPLALDLGPETDQVFLIVFGTGFRGRSSLSATSATMGGVNTEVLFAGAQGDLAGLDQANLRIPRTLAGRGEIDVVLRVDGKAANTVKINVK
jgi:uncharacterized protein (TIGR03437 family)